MRRFPAVLCSIVVLVSCCSFTNAFGWGLDYSNYDGPLTSKGQAEAAGQGMSIRTDEYGFSFCSPSENRSFSDTISSFSRTNDVIGNIQSITADFARLDSGANSFISTYNGSGSFTIPGVQNFNLNTNVVSTAFGGLDMPAGTNATVNFNASGNITKISFSEPSTGKTFACMSLVDNGQIAATILDTTYAGKGVMSFGQDHTAMLPAGLGDGMRKNEDNNLGHNRLGVKDEYTGQRGDIKPGDKIDLAFLGGQLVGMEVNGGARSPDVSFGLGRAGIEEAGIVLSGVNPVQGISDQPAAEDNRNIDLTSDPDQLSVYQAGSIIGAVEKMGAYDIYFTFNLPTEGYVELKYAYFDGAVHNRYIKASDLLVASNVIEFTNDPADLAKNVNRPLLDDGTLGPLTNDPIDISKTAFMNISYVDPESGAVLYLGTVDMKRYDDVSYGVEPVAMLSDASLLTNSEIASLYGTNGLINPDYGRYPIESGQLLPPAVIQTPSGNRVIGVTDTLRDKIQRENIISKFAIPASQGGFWFDQNMWAWWQDAWKRE